MEAQVAELVQEMMRLRQRVADQEIFLQQAQQAKGKGKGGPPLARQDDRGDKLDMKTLKGLDSFDGSEKAWRDWKVVTKSYASVVDPVLAGLMARAESGQEEVKNEDLLEEGEEAASVKLYMLLLHSCKGPALDKVVNSGQNEGAHAWKMLNERYDPKATTRQAGLLQSVLSWSFAGDPLERLEAWERELARYTQMSGAAFPDGLKIGMVIKNLEDGSLKNHLMFNSERLSDWPSFRRELVSVRTVLGTSSGSGAAPMDIGAVGDRFAGNCWHCGKPGHKTQDCRLRSKKGDSKGGKDKGKGGGKGGKGKGDQKGGKDKNRRRLQCWTCGGDHRQQDCPRGGGKQGVRALDEDEGVPPPPEPHFQLRPTRSAPTAASMTSSAASSRPTALPDAGSLELTGLFIGALDEIEFSLSSAGAGRRAGH